APLRSTPADPPAARVAELEKLGALLPRADGEGRRVALIAGEPGVGKSRLVREFARAAADSGALVLYGACDATARAPYGPFVEALDRLTRVIEADELRAATRPGGGPPPPAPRPPPPPGPPATADRRRPRHRAPPPPSRGRRDARLPQP